MIPEPAVAEKTKPKAKTTHCTNARPNKLPFFISFIAMSLANHKFRIKHFDPSAGPLPLTPGFRPVYAALQRTNCSNSFLPLRLYSGWALG